MNELSERILAEENRAAGRVIPAWRYWIAYLMMPISWLANGFVEKFEPPFWVEVASLVIPAIVFMVMLESFKKKVIR